MTIDGLTELKLEASLHMAIIKMQGHKYEDLKKKLRIFYDMNKFPYPYEDLERLFDKVWSNVIEVKSKEDLK
jgi:hypothetical protein